MVLTGFLARARTPWAVIAARGYGGGSPRIDARDQASRGTGNNGQMATIDMYLTTDATTCSLQAQGVSLTQ